MNDRVRWEDGNSHYLSLALACLRMRLERAIDQRSAADDSTAERLADIEDRLAACEAACEVPPAAVHLCERFGLSRFERDVLLLCVAMDLDTGIAELCALAQGDPRRNYPTFALAFALFADSAWEALSPQRPLRYFRLIEANTSSASPLTACSLHADERIVNYIKGLNHLDERLLSILAPGGLVGASEPLQESQQRIAGAIVQAWAGADASDAAPVAQLLGSCKISKQMVERSVAARLGCQVWRISADDVPNNIADQDLIARLWQRECILQPLILCADGVPSDSARATASDVALRRFLGRTAGLTILECRDPVAISNRTHIALEVHKPTTLEQRVVWNEVVGDANGRVAGELAAQFDLDVSTIRQIAQRVQAEVGDDPEAMAGRLWERCKASVRPGLDSLAERIDANATWDDIVLPAEPLALLRQVCAQVRGRSLVYDTWGFAARMNRGLGISVLFEGASGVGKTMAAEVIANDLRLNLYRIDLSSVVSKYIGETEGNLRRLFDAAEDGGAILFFDECDALFSKRSEVKDSHDRYANIEVNYLLQRIETYRGLAILATNLKSALDSAFIRRLRFIINFAFPSVLERLLMWQKVFPSQVPCAALDWERLSRLNLTGGNIHNAALSAAFLAAEAGTSVTMAIVLAAIRTEFVKLGRPINEAEFQIVRKSRAVA